MFVFQSLENPTLTQNVEYFLVYSLNFFLVCRFKIKIKTKQKTTEWILCGKKTKIETKLFVTWNLVVDMFILYSFKMKIELKKNE